ncbi:hypothetical protein HY837_06810 [archaeon]|nr:hypothetical protein [archaeon]
MITEIDNQAYRKAPGLDEILSSFRGAYSAAHRKTGKKMYESPKIKSESRLEGVAKVDAPRTFTDFALNYFSNEGEEFGEYLRSIGRSVKNVKGVAHAKMRSNSYLMAVTKGDDAFIVQNENMDWRHGVFYLSGEYDVENSVMREYLLMHEHAHLSQSDLKNKLRTELAGEGLTGKEFKLAFTKALEKDVEETVFEYANNMYVHTGNEKYNQIASIAKRRSEEVDWHYRG